MLPAARTIELINSYYRSRTLELALHTSSPTSSASLANEIAVDRAPLVLTDPVVALPVVNNATLIFENMPAVTAFWGSIHDAVTGDMLAFAPIANPTSSPGGTSYSIPAGSLAVTLE